MMYKKRLISVFVMFLLVLSTFSFAAESESVTSDETIDSCTGFWGSIGCFLWGNSENWAGKSWFDRGNALVGEAASLGSCVIDGKVNVNKGDFCVSQNDNGENIVLIAADDNGDDCSNTGCQWYLAKYDSQKGKFTKGSSFDETGFNPAEGYTSSKEAEPCQDDSCSSEDAVTYDAYSDIISKEEAAAAESAQTIALNTKLSTYSTDPLVINNKVTYSHSVGNKDYFYDSTGQGYVGSGNTISKTNLKYDSSTSKFSPSDGYAWKYPNSKKWDVVGIPADAQYSLVVNDEIVFYKIVKISGVDIVQYYSNSKWLPSESKTADDVKKGKDVSSSAGMAGKIVANDKAAETSKVALSGLSSEQQELIAQIKETKWSNLKGQAIITAQQAYKSAGVISTTEMEEWWNVGILPWTVNSFKQNGVASPDMAKKYLAVSKDVGTAVKLSGAGAVPLTDDILSGCPSASGLCTLDNYALVKLDNGKVVDVFDSKDYALYTDDVGVAQQMWEKSVTPNNLAMVVSSCEENCNEACYNNLCFSVDGEKIISFREVESIPAGAKKIDASVSSGSSSSKSSTPIVSANGNTITSGGNTYSLITVNNVNIFCQIKMTNVCFKFEDNVWVQVDKTTLEYCAQDSVNCNKKASDKSTAYKSTGLKGVTVGADGKAATTAVKAAETLKTYTFTADDIAKALGTTKEQLEKEYPKYAEVIKSAKVYATADPQPVHYSNIEDLNTCRTAGCYIYSDAGTLRVSPSADKNGVFSLEYAPLAVTSSTATTTTAASSTATSSGYPSTLTVMDAKTGKQGTLTHVGNGIYEGVENNPPEVTGPMGVKIKPQKVTTRVKVAEDGTVTIDSVTAETTELGIQSCHGDTECNNLLDSVPDVAAQVKGAKDQVKAEYLKKKGTSAATTAPATATTTASSDEPQFTTYTVFANGLTKAGLIFNAANANADEISINGKTLYLESGKTAKDLKDKMADGNKDQPSSASVKLFYDREDMDAESDSYAYLTYDKEAKASTVTEVENTFFGITDYQLETDHTTGVQTHRNGQIEKDKFVPDSGVIYGIGDKGQEYVQYVVNYDETDKGRVAELFNPESGKYVGTVQDVGDYKNVQFEYDSNNKLIAKYNGQALGSFTEKDGDWVDDSNGRNLDTALYNAKNPADNLDLSAEEQDILSAANKLQSKIVELSKTVSDKQENSNAAAANYKQAEATYDNSKTKVNQILSSDNKVLLPSDLDSQFASASSFEDFCIKNAALCAVKSSSGVSYVKSLYGQYEVLKRSLKGAGTLTTDYADSAAPLNVLESDWSTQTDPKYQQQIIEALGYDYDEFVAQHSTNYVPLGSGELSGYYVNAQGLMFTKQGEEYVLADPTVSSTLAATYFDEFTSAKKTAATSPSEGIAAALGEEQAKIKAAVEKQKQLEQKKAKGTAAEAATENKRDLTLQSAQTAIESVYVLQNAFNKDYSALNRLFWGDAGWYKDWKGWSDQTFAPMLGSNWFPSAICESQYDITPEGTAVIKTVSGTYQPVASIQAERSPQKSDLLCQPNLDPKAAEEFICDKDQVCKDNLCYPDLDNDQEPDAEAPLQGYFYKITWGVSAPQDEAFTPYIDEDGTAVSFNIWLYNSETDYKVPLYRRGGDTQGPIKLKNGASDKQAIAKYSAKMYDQACIVWHQAPKSMSTFSFETISDVCFDIVQSTIGEVDYNNPGGNNYGGSTVSEGEVSSLTNW